MWLRERTRPGLGIIEASSTCSRAHSCVIDQGAGSDTIVPGRVLNLIATCRRAAIRLVACLTMCLMPILASATQAHAQAASDPQAYCVNRSADFYPYTGELCKSGYQLGSGNCRKADGRMVAVSKEDCVAMGGLVALPFEGGRGPFDGAQPTKPIK
jgi:hypothetical protein